MGCTKNYRIAVIAVFLIIGGLINSIAFGQTSIQRVNNKTYVYDSQKKMVYNQMYTPKSSELYATEGFQIENHSIVKETFRKILSKERLTELKKDAVIVMFECHANGEIERVKFLFSKTPFLTVSEIEKLENAFLKQKFIISSELNPDQLIKFSVPCRFSRI